MRFHLFPFRTEKLSSLTPMVLRLSRGRVGSRLFKPGCQLTARLFCFMPPPSSFRSTFFCAFCPWLPGCRSAAWFFVSRLSLSSSLSTFFLCPTSIDSSDFLFQDFPLTSSLSTFFCAFCSWLPGCRSPARFFVSRLSLSSSL